MDIWLDNQEKEFREILIMIRQFRSGELADLQKSYGLNYKMNWGVALPDLRKIASAYLPSHVLALKLWNRQWRETMILATMLDQPEEVTEEQMDFWTKSLENSEIAGQVSANLWSRTPYAYAKALEWCRGKKHWTRYTAVHLAGRLALTDKKSPDEIFETFLEEFKILMRDPGLSPVLYHTIIALAGRSEVLRQLVMDWTEQIKQQESGFSLKLAGELEEGIKYV